MVLHSFIHISDLHIGATTKWKRSIVSSLPSLPFLSKLAVGHDVDALTQLSRFYDTYTSGSDRNATQLVLTGDLTSYGTSRQSQTASAFLSAATSLGESDLVPMGLGEKEWNKTSVTGNHDYVIPPVKHCHPYFSSFPSTWVSRINPLDSAPFQIRFICIDTDADVSRRSLDYVMARGDFESQLDELDRLIPTYNVEDREIRILIMHHAYDMRRCGSYWDGTLEIVGRSKRRLQKFLSQHRIPVVLSGHLHVPNVSICTANAGWEFLEGRCGTTTQTRDPGDSIDLTREERDAIFNTQNSLLVHKIEEQSDHNEASGKSLLWSTKTFGRKPVSGFQPLDSSNFPTMSGSIKVWPR